MMSRFTVTSYSADVANYNPFQFLYRLELSCLLPSTKSDLVIEKSLSVSCWNIEDAFWR